MWKKHSIFNFLIILLLFFLNSCGGAWDSVKRGLTGTKAASTDEFLVEKKDPLVLPPNFNNLPEPGKDSYSQDVEDIDIENILSQNQSIDDQTFTETSSVEENILRQLKK